MGCLWDQLNLRKGFVISRTITTSTRFWQLEVNWRGEWWICNFVGEMASLMKCGWSSMKRIAYRSNIFIMGLLSQRVDKGLWSWSTSFSRVSLGNIRILRCLGIKPLDYNYFEKSLLNIDIVKLVSQITQNCLIKS